MQFEKEYPYEGGTLFVFGEIDFDGDDCCEVDVQGTVFTNAHGDEIEDDAAHIIAARRLAREDVALSEECEAQYYEDNPRPRWHSDFAEHTTHWGRP